MKNLTPAELYKLPLAERVAYYREQAAEATQAAQSATDPAARASMLMVAENWTRLADHMRALRHQ